MEFILNEKLMEYRKLNNFTQEDVAKKLGITNQAVSKWESGICCPDIVLLPKIAAVYNVSIDALFGLEDDNTKKEKSEWRKNLLLYYNAWIEHMTNGNSILAVKFHVLIETLLNPKDELQAAFQKELRQAVEEIKIDAPFGLKTQRIFSITPLLQNILNK